MSYFICLPGFIDFGHSVTEIWGGIRPPPPPPPGCEMGPKSPGLLGLSRLGYKGPEFETS